MERRGVAAAGLALCCGAILILAARRSAATNPPAAAVKSVSLSPSASFSSSAWERKAKSSASTTTDGTAVDNQAESRTKRSQAELGNEDSPRHEWRTLFNGRDLSGWRHVGGGRSFVQGGVLMLAHDAERKTGYLVSSLTARNFRASIRCQVPTGDSGFYFRAALDPHTSTEVLGLQVQLNLQPGCGLGGLFEPQRRGWLVKPDFNGKWKTADAQSSVIRSPSSIFHSPFSNRNDSSWLNCDITVLEKHVHVAINGITTVDFTDPDPDNRYQEAGFFALQIHGGGYCDARFQEIRIQPLD